MNKPVKNLDNRDTLFSEILKYMDVNEDILILTADMTCWGLAEIKAKYPDRVINMGISEQNMISVAAGLTLGGKKVICYAIAAFLIFRALDQIRVDIGGMNLPVILIGDGAGKTYLTDGMTHWALYDWEIMRDICGISTETPDRNRLLSILRTALIFDKPYYIRLVRE